MIDLSNSCDLCHSCSNVRSFNPLCWASSLVHLHSNPSCCSRILNPLCHHGNSLSDCFYTYIIYLIYVHKIYVKAHTLMCINCTHTHSMQADEILQTEHHSVTSTLYAFFLLYYIAELYYLMSFQFYSRKKGFISQFSPSQSAVN